MLHFTTQIYATRDLESFGRTVLRGLHGLVGADQAGYNEMDLATSRITSVDDPVGVSGSRIATTSSRDTCSTTRWRLTSPRGRTIAA